MTATTATATAATEAATTAAEEAATTTTTATAVDTTATTTTTELRSLLEHVSVSTIVCIDEAYREFVDPGFGDPVTELLPDFPNVIVTRTFSKAHGLAGLRIVALAPPPSTVTRELVLAANRAALTLWRKDMDWSWD